MRDKKNGEQETTGMVEGGGGWNSGSERKLVLGRDRASAWRRDERRFLGWVVVWRKTVE